MIYYKVALPLNLKDEYIYFSKEEIKSGNRVLVSFHNQLLTGIIYQQINEIDEKISYKEITEIIDDEPVISKEQIKLAQWMSNYYHTRIGQILFAMLPAALDVMIQQEIRKIKDGIFRETEKSAEELLNLLNGTSWLPIGKIKNKVKIKRFQFWLDFLENKGFIEIKRTFDAKIKKKIKNYIILTNINVLPKLTEKQSSAYIQIKNIGHDFPLAKISKEISYSIVKALRNKGLVRIEPREERVSHKIFPNTKSLIKKEIVFTDEQNKIIFEINENIEKRIFKSYLLYGITGSGKTEVYIEAIKKCLEIEKNALMLVPEISLTPQLLAKFYEIFSDKIAVLHSNLNSRERWEQWEKIHKGKSRIVIGVRSAIFAPLKNIGLIIVDEEHESTYKQENNPRYNARDIAIVRAKMNNSLVILGSATPSLESWCNVDKQKYELLTIKNRPFQAKLPDIEIYDLKELDNHKNAISNCLANKIENRLKKKEQIILFQNRRGHSSFVQCVSCGHLFTCPNCSISYNFHSYDMSLKCHYCGDKIRIPRQCPKCGSYVFKFGALGTQQIEKQLQVLFPTARILRMDSDTTNQKDSYKAMFDKMRNGHIDILLGTQMISKGLDFENVTLVGVISADTILNFPDFRSAERTFQLLTQVAGRSGRGEKPGEVIIQTYNPEHYAIKCAVQQNYDEFAAIELKLRRILLYPPYYRMVRFIFSARKNDFLNAQLDSNRQIITNLRKIFPPSDLKILGPVPTPLIKIKNEYRQHVIIKAKTVDILNKSINYIKQNLKLSNLIKQRIDVDPYSLL